MCVFWFMDTRLIAESVCDSEECKPSDSCVCVSIKKQDHYAGACMCEFALVGKGIYIEGIVVYLTAHTRPMRVYIDPSSSLSDVSAALSVKKK